MTDVPYDGLDVKLVLVTQQLHLRTEKTHKSSSTVLVFSFENQSLIFGRIKNES